MPDVTIPSRASREAHCIVNVMCVFPFFSVKIVVSIASPQSDLEEGLAQR